MECPVCKQTIEKLNEWKTQPIKTCPKCGNVVEVEGGKVSDINPKP